jgi:hypothetical protein
LCADGSLFTPIRNNIHGPNSHKVEEKVKEELKKKIETLMEGKSMASEASPAEKEEVAKEV